MADAPASPEDVTETAEVGDSPGGGTKADDKSPEESFGFLFSTRGTTPSRPSFTVV